MTVAAATGITFWNLLLFLLPLLNRHHSGEWCNDVMHGFGQMLLASGSSLSGCWWKGRMHGLCRHISRRDGSTYEGSMVHGERRGRGKLTFAWADVFEGEMARDLPNGSGVMLTSAGPLLVNLSSFSHTFFQVILSGEYLRIARPWVQVCLAGIAFACVKNDPSSRAGDGIKVLPDGRRFTGTHRWRSLRNGNACQINACSGCLLDGRPHGQGMVDKDACQVSCTFDEGVFLCYNDPKDW